MASSTSPLHDHGNATQISYRAAGADTGDMSKDTLFNKETRAPQRTGICAPCQWFKEKPMSRWQFAVMLLFAVLCILWVPLRLTGELTTDIASGICGFILAVYGANHFRILLGLKEQVDKFRKNNRMMRKTNGELKVEVSKLTKATEELKGVVSRLEQVQRGHEENISKMKQIEEKLSRFGEDSIAGITKLKEMTQYVNDSVVKELRQHERDILQRVRDGIEFRDENEGLSEDEYLQFLEALPSNYKRKFQALGDFQTVSGGDSNISLEEFTELCDKFAAEVADKKAAAK